MKKCPYCGTIMQPIFVIPKGSKKSPIIEKSLKQSFKCLNPKCPHKSSKVEIITEEPQEILSK